MNHVIQEECDLLNSKITMNENNASSLLINYPQIDRILPQPIREQLLGVDQSEDDGFLDQEDFCRRLISVSTKWSRVHRFIVTVKLTYKRRIDISKHLLTLFKWTAVAF